MRRTMFAIATAASLLWHGAPLAHAEPTPPPTPATLSPSAIATSVQAAADAANRLTVKVMINHRGPFDFVVDTGADHTVISTELAAALALPPGPAVLLHASSGTAREPTVLIDHLAVGALDATHIKAAVLPRSGLGALGLLGVDSVRDQAMIMDFRTHRLIVQPIAPDQVDPLAIEVSARNRYGQLILLDARVNGTPVFVILDSGAQVTVANAAFRRAFGQAPDPDGTTPRGPARVLSVINGATAGAYATLSALTLGDITVQNLPVVFADLDTFRLFHLDTRPAMLLGMNALRQFDRVSIDYRHRQVRFSLNRAAQVATPLDAFMMQSVTQ